MVTVNLIKVGSKMATVVSDTVDMANVLSIRFEFGHGGALDVRIDPSDQGLEIRTGAKGDMSRVIVEPIAVNSVIVKPVY